MAFFDGIEVIFDTRMTAVRIEIVSDPCGEVDFDGFGLVAVIDIVDNRVGAAVTVELIEAVAAGEEIVAIAADQMILAVATDQEGWICPYRLCGR